jgi:hypothetical protein
VFSKGREEGGDIVYETEKAADVRSFLGLWPVKDAGDLRDISRDAGSRDVMSKECEGGAKKVSFLGEQKRVASRKAWRMRATLISCSSRVCDQTIISSR